MTGRSDACGTYGGYQRHTRRNDTPCFDCCAAAATYMRDWRRKRGVVQSALVPIDVIEAAIRQCDPDTASALRRAMDPTSPGTAGQRPDQSAAPANSP